MEIIIAIAIVIGAVAVYFNRKPKTVEVTTEVPYKVETPAVEEAPVVATETVEAVIAGVPAAKKPRKPRAPKAEATAKKPAAKKAPAKARATKTVKSKKA